MLLGNGKNYKNTDWLKSPVDPSQDTKDQTPQFLVQSLVNHTTQYNNREQVAKDAERGRNALLERLNITGVTGDGDPTFEPGKPRLSPEQILHNTYLFPAAWTFAQSYRVLRDMAETARAYDASERSLIDHGADKVARVYS